MADKIDLSVITKDPKVLQRCERICKAFDYNIKHAETVETFLDDMRECRMILIHGGEELDGEGIDEIIRTLMSAFSDAFILCLISEKGGKKLAALAKDAGASLILLEDEFFSTSKPEYICTQVIRATYIAIKSSDIVLGVPLGFDLYHLLPQRNKFLKFAFEGDEISEAKLQKIGQASEVYIHKDHAEKFAKYVTQYSDKSPDSVAKRCRAQFLALSAVYTSLVFLVTDQSEHGSFKKGDELLKKCQELTTTLLVTLGSQKSAWDVINRSVIGDFGSVERSPAVAAYAALFALLMDVDKIERLMVATLFSEVGLLFLPPETTEALRKNDLGKLSPEQKAAYQTYPLKSLNVVLDRKLQIDEKMRDLVLKAHERADGKGLPGKYRDDNIPTEAFLIQFASEVDQRTVVRMGQAAISPEQIYQQLVDEEKKKPGRFTQAFLDKVTAALGVE